VKTGSPRPERWIAVNGRILPEDEASISPADRGFLYGDGLFETMKARKGRVDFLSKHLTRMEEAAGVLDLPFPLDFDIPSLLRELLDKNHLAGTASVKICLSRGKHLGPLTLYPDQEPTLVIFTRPYEDPGSSRWEKGLEVSVEEEIRQNALSGICHLKSMNYLPYLLARTRAEEKGFEESLLLNTEGHVCECTTANIFCFRQGRLETPLISCGLLPGILRAVLLELLDKAGQPARVVRLTVEDLMGSEEIFVTNSMIEILPVGRLNERRYPQREQTRTLFDRFRAYRNALREEI